jgi:type II secretory pathway component GspD/PulD (secretin)
VNVLHRTAATLSIAASLTLIAGPAYAAKTYGVDVVNADIEFATDLLAKATGRDIVLDGNVGHQLITISFAQANPDDAVNFFAHSEGLSVEQYHGAYILLRKQDIADRAPNMLVTRVIPLKYANPAQTVATLQTLLTSSGGTAGTSSSGATVQLAANIPSRAVVLRGPFDQVQSAAQIAESLDQPSFGHTILTQTFPYNSGKPSDALAAIRSALGEISQDDQLIANDAAGTINGVGDANFLKRVAAILAGYDRYGQQVLYDVRIVELTPIADSKTLGFLTNGFGGSGLSNGSALNPGSLGYGYATKGIGIFTQLDALVQHGAATVISDPQIVASNNVQQALNATEQYPIPTSVVSNGVTSNSVTYTPIGLTLKVTPTIGNDGSVLTNIDTTWSSILSFASGYPVIGQRQTTGSFRIGNDESLVLSGLIQDVDLATLQKTPILGDIPILGIFFRHLQENRTKDELVFILTPHIKAPVLKSDDVPAPFIVPPVLQPSYPDHPTILPGVKSK